LFTAQCSELTFLGGFDFVVFPEYLYEVELRMDANFAEQVSAAHIRIKKDIRRTPLEFSAPLGEVFGSSISVKWDNQQITGSFKFRGALNKLRSLSEVEKRKGVVSASTGNHGLAISHACGLENGPLTLFLPENASPAKIEKIKKYPVALKFFGLDCEKAERHARLFARENGLVYVSPYNDSDIVYGQGTAGLELYEDLPGTEVVLVPVGGGGLIAGIAGYLKSRNPRILVYGVEPENSRFMKASLEAGKLIEIVEKKTIADGVAGGIEPGSITFPLCQKYVDDIVLVKEWMIKKAMGLFFAHHRQVIEGAGALPLAAVIARPGKFRDRKIVLVVSGGNIGAELFWKIVPAAKT